jgi:mannose-6-phosphate isomerase-like protein (cupin superfamily)
MQATLHRFKPDTEYYFAEGCFITELCNTAADGEVSIARARLEPEKCTRWHRLRATAERYVILQGAGRIEIGEQLREDVAAADVVVIPPMTPQRICNTGGVDLVFLVICTPRFTAQAYEALEE